MAKKKPKKFLSNSENVETKISKDNSPQVFQNAKLNSPLHIQNKQPLTARQTEFINLVLDNKCKLVFVSGPAGSSKTFMSIFAGLKLLDARKLSDIVYVRSAVESSDKSLGFLPGELKEKLDPYLEPLEEKLMEFLPKNDITMLKKEERIIPMPVGFMRGLSWNAKCIIADEAQNMSVKELVTLITRVGEYSKLFICGDPMQSDIAGKSGFTKIMNHFNTDEAKGNGIFCFEFTEEDIVRSALVKFIIKHLKTLPS